MERLPVNKLKANPNNPRVIRDEKFKKLVKSIKEFPEMLEARPVVVNPDMVVLGGNMRLKALREAGVEEAPVYIASWDEVKQRQFIIKDNVGFGEWDWDALANEWNEEELQDWGLDIPGFEEMQEVLEAEEDDFDVPDEIKTDIVPGDLFEIGEHRLLCGDSTDGGNVEKLMNKEQAVLLHADPPYGMGKEKEGVLNDNLYKDKLDRFQMEWWTAFRPYLTNNASAYIWGNAPDLWRLWYKGGLEDSERMTMRNEIAWDKEHGEGMGSDKYRMYPTASERCLFFMLGEQGFNNNADNYWEGWESLRLYLEAERNKMGWNNKIIADFFGFHPRMSDHWFSQSQWSMPKRDQYERMQSEAKGQAFRKTYDQLKKEHDQLKKDFYKTRAYFDNTHDNMTEVWQFERVTGEERHGHATPKPIEMMNRIIKSSSPDNALMIEPFLGSGSTMVAAHQLGRKCYGMELDPKYCQVIVDRMHKLDPSLQIKRNGQPYEAKNLETN
jgi:DNA modification methylase